MNKNTFVSYCIDAVETLVRPMYPLDDKTWKVIIRDGYTEVTIFVGDYEKSKTQAAYLHSIIETAIKNARMPTKEPTPLRDMLEADAARMVRSGNPSEGYYLKGLYEGARIALDHAIKNTGESVCENVLYIRASTLDDMMEELK